MRWAWILLALVPGCFDAHGRDGDSGPTPEDASVPVPDAGGPADAGPPCVTTCGSAAVLARLELDVSGGLVPAVLDAVVHRDELVAAVLRGPVRPTDPLEPFSLIRVSRRDGSVRLETVPVSTWVSSIGAGALVSEGDRLTLIAAHAVEDSFTPEDIEPRVSVATWDGAAASPRVTELALTEAPLPRCVGCLRRGASVAIDGEDGLVLLADDGGLLVGRIGLVTPDVARETIEIAELMPNTAVDARSDRSGSALVALGGTREIGGASPAPASALVAPSLDAPIAIPGTESDSTPYPWVHGERVEVARFVRDDGSARGTLRRFAIEGGAAIERERIETAGGLPPLAIGSAGPVLVWAESSLASPGESDIRVLALADSCADMAIPINVAHVETPLGTQDPRVLTATEADGRTYVLLVEQEAVAPRRAWLTVLDLGVCAAE